MNKKNLQGDTADWTSTGVISGKGGKMTEQLIITGKLLIIAVRLLITQAFLRTEEALGSGLLR